MYMQRTTRLSFNHRSLALFSALVVGSGLAAAQFTIGPASAAIARSPSAPTTDLFRKLDVDGNGSISRKEAAGAGGYFARNFDALDTNHDGLLSRAEFEQASR